MITVAPHPLLDLDAFVSELDHPLGEIVSPAGLVALLRLDAPAPLTSSDALRGAVRDLLRHGGFKPTGRSKPASEYLLRAATDGSLGPINPVVDACNVASLHGGLPISVVDLDKVVGALRVEVAPAGASYVFNTSGQEIDLSGLLCLMDEAGPCANAVKDAQRTKTGPSTRRTLSLVWGTTAAPGRAAATGRWYRELVVWVGGRTSDALSAAGASQRPG